MYQISLRFPAEFSDQHINQLGEAFEDSAEAFSALREGSHRGPWRISWVIAEQPNTTDMDQRLQNHAAAFDIDLPPLSWESEKINTDTNWLEQSYRQFPPFSVGPFFIHGSHHEGEIPAGQFGLKIDAATAFGSGEHGTTKGCLQAMLEMKGRGQCPWNVLDMGTGSGILAIAAWKLWKTPILATDIDPECVRVTENHADINGVKLGGSCLSTQTGDGFAAPLVGKKAPFDLIIANILAGPLIEMVDDLAAVSDSRGSVILSGMLNEQADKVLAAYEGRNFTLQQRYDIGEWTTLLLQNR